MRPSIRSSNPIFAALLFLATLTACGEREQLLLGPVTVLNPADPRYMEQKYGTRPLPQVITRPGAIGVSGSVISGSTSPSLSLNGLNLSTSGVIGAPAGWESNLGLIQRFGDDYSELRAIGFPFVFYGKSYTQLWVGSNGHVSFNKRNLRWWASTIPDEDFAIAGPAYGDWSMNNRIGDATANVYMNVLGTAPNRRLVITWNRVRACCFVTNPPNSFQLQLFEGTNEIKFLYNGITQVHNVMNVGISSGTGPFIKDATGGQILDLDGCILSYVPNGAGYTSARDCSARQSNHPPTAAANGPYSAEEGVAIQFVATALDPDGNDLHYSWDFGDGSSATGANVSHAYGNNGSYTATLTVSDGYLNATASAAVTVINAAPTARFELIPEVNEGSDIRIALVDGADASAADLAAGLAFAFDCGDGQGFGPFGAGNEASCPTIDDQVRTVRGRVRDRDGGLTEYSGSVRVNNVAPAITVGNVAAVRSGDLFSLAGAFSDRGVLDRVWTERIEWGDGSSEEQIAEEQSQPIAGQHRFLEAKTYTVKLAVTDKDGGTGWATIDLVVERLGVPVVVRPGQDRPIRLNEHLKLPVAVLTTPGFDAQLINPASARLGATAVKARRNASLEYSFQDVDADGDVDALLRFDVGQLIANGDLTLNSRSLVLIADLVDGRQVQGTDQVTVVGNPGDSRRAAETSPKTP